MDEIAAKKSDGGKMRITASVADAKKLGHASFAQRADAPCVPTTFPPSTGTKYLEAHDGSSDVRADR